MIQIKKKPCKGTGLAKRYGCGRPVNKRTCGLGHECRCYPNWLFNAPGAKEKRNKFLNKNKKNSKEVTQLGKKNKKEKNTNWKLKLQEKINEIVRLIDIDQPCLARDYHPNQIHAGHIYARGSFPELKFNLHNIHRQSAQSNLCQNEDDSLKEGLSKEYGINYMEFISCLRRCETLKYSNNEYHHFYKKAIRIAKRLKSEGKNNNIKERICLRNELNLELEIYKEEYCIFKITD